ncbi:MAG: hypothetical protein KF729_08065 [Sandaracinaceae bacterium]|nr:hypothetical protein [Sandaracinaceae bacterium]
MTEPNRDDTLQRHFDGDLAPEEAEAFRAELEADADLRARLEGLERLRTLLRAALAPEHVEAPDGDAAFAAIERALSEPPAAIEPAAEAERPRPALRAIAGGAPKASPPTSRMGLWVSVATVGLAAAAAVAFFVLRAPDAPARPDPIATASPPPGSEIEQIDFGHSTGAIFQVEDQGAQYAVVWISDEKPEDPHAPSLDRDEGRDRIQ